MRTSKTDYIEIDVDDCSLSRAIEILLETREAYGDEGSLETEVQEEYGSTRAVLYYEYQRPLTEAEKIKEKEAAEKRKAYRKAQYERLKKEFE